MRTEDFDYELPPELIAQRPAERRDASRLLVVPPAGPFEHRTFAELPALLPEGALLVVNDARVVPARVRVKKETGGEGEVLFLEPLAGGRFAALVRGKNLKPGAILTFAPPPGRAPAGPPPRVRFDDRQPDGTAEVSLLSDGAAGDAIFGVLDAWGELPLPPYIERADGVTDDDTQRYQTVWARVPGAVAAPTAGLHFTDGTLAALGARGIRRVPLTLHVGFGTFAPVRDGNLDKHVMHEERFDVPAATADAIADARREGRPVVAVGTTVVRALEASQGAAGPGRTRLFITPGFRFGIVDRLITNFHLPKSTLLMLVSAFAGRARILAAYREAVERRYRFFSFGDAMLLTREAA